MQDMYDETMQNFKQMNNNFQEIITMLEKLSKSGQMAKEKLPEMILTGDWTDIAHCKDGLSKNAINTLDPQAKESLIKNLEIAEKQGLIEVDFNIQDVSLTDKGKQYCSSSNFQRDFNANQAKFKADSAEQFGIELSGTDKDLLFFKSNKAMDLKSINWEKASPEIKAKFAKNLEKWQKNGIVQMDKNFKVSLTDKGKKLLSSKDFAKAVGKGKLAEKALSAVSGGGLAIITKIIVKAVKAVTSANQKSAQALE